MLAFLGISVIVMASYDTRFVCAVMLASIILFLQQKFTGTKLAWLSKLLPFCGREPITGLCLLAAIRWGSMEANMF